jgi:uncharacterized protein (DUF1015 family)
MSLIRPFAALRPAPGRADEVVAPPYDVVSADEALARAAGKPFSFLHISRPEIDLPPHTDPYSPAVYAKGRENFLAQVQQGVLLRDPEAYYYVYRLTMGSHVQTGLVATASVQAYDQQRIRRHEFTRVDKEDDRVRQVDALGAQTGPAFLTYRHVPEVTVIQDRTAQGTPDVDVVADDGVRHQLWVLKDRGQIDRLTAAFDAMDRLYIADGHHRSAAASRVAAARRAKTANPTGNEPWDYFLAVIFPDDQMQILDYNRVVRDLHGHAPAGFLAKLAPSFEVEPVAQAVKPRGTGEFSMYLDGKWYRLRVRPERVPQNDPVGRLDVSVLAAQVIEPLLGISDPRRDKRIDFVGGIRGLAALQARVDSGEMAVALSPYPTSMAELMAVADVGEVMPPKSTWFEPKLADGLFSHVID